MKSILYRIIIITIILCFSCSCGNADTITVVSTYDYESAAATISQASGLDVTAEFLKKNFEKKEIRQLVSAADSGEYTQKTWLEVTGYSYYVISDMIKGVQGAQNITNYGSNGKSTVSISVAGDITFAPERPVMLHAAENGGVLKCFDKSLVRQVKASDIFLLNCETAISEIGEPIADKAWTFRSHPESIGFLHELGVDVVSLANNHVYDYGEAAFADTMQNLKNAGMPYVGAGMNLVEAVNGHYFIVNGIKIGIVAASRAEKYYMTPVATFAAPGIMGTYDSEDFLESIKIARQRCDFLIAYVHWGTEYSKELDEAQKTMSREYIEAGADAVIGAHPHCLQGMEFYNGAPIIYSLGNFWFNDKTLDSGIVTLEIDKDMNLKVEFTPLLQDSCETKLVTKRKERRALFDRIESYEPQGVVISNDGEVTPSGSVAEP